MEKILVVYDGTEASRLMFDMLQTRIMTERINASVKLFKINRTSVSGLSSGSGISEFKGDIRHLADNIGDTSILLIHLAPVSREVLEAAHNLKYIGTERSSLVNIDVQEAKKRGITICYAPGRNARTVAEFTIGLIFDVTRHISAAHAAVTSRLWSKELDKQAFKGIELDGKRLGLVGLGAIGRTIVDLLQDFGMDIIFYDPYVKNDYNSARSTTLENLLSACDIISIHARSENNACIIGENEFAVMKQNAYVINTARGYLLDQHALIRHLQSGHLAGAALDVFCSEPVEPDSPLLNMSNVVLCPHIGGLSSDMAPRSANYVIEDVIRFIKKEPLIREYQP